MLSLDTDRKAAVVQENTANQVSFRARNGWKTFSMQHGSLLRSEFQHSNFPQKLFRGRLLILGNLIYLSIIQGLPP